MSSKESIPGGGQEKLSREEQVEVDLAKEGYKKLKQEQPNASEEDIHRAIITRLGYYLGIPGYGLKRMEEKGAKPTEEQQARLEELYQMVVEEDEPTGWDSLAADSAFQEENKQEENRQEDDGPAAVQAEADRARHLANQRIESSPDHDLAEEASDVDFDNPDSIPW